MNCKFSHAGAVEGRIFEEGVRIHVSSALFFLLEIETNNCF
jgi:hypothetical protein